MTKNLDRNKNRGASGDRRSLVGVLLVAIGLILIGASWAPLGRLASEAMWTGEDSAAYAELRQQRHRSKYQSPSRAGLSEAERKAQQQGMKIQAEAMRKKLEIARMQPRRWSQRLLWIGALLTAIGALSHFTASR